MTARETDGAWVLVPKEPTEEMVTHGAAQVRDFYSEDGQYPRTKAMWRAMLAAAPASPPDEATNETYYMSPEEQATMAAALRRSSKVVASPPPASGEEFEELRKAAEGTTPEPWWYQEKSDAYTHIVRAGSHTFICQLPQDTSGKAEADARFIALAKNTLPAVLARLDALKAEVAGVTKERDEALERVDELDAHGETIAAEFEGECWKAMRRLLASANFDFDGDPVTADTAEQHLAETMNDLERQLTAVRADRDRARADERATIVAWLRNAPEARWASDDFPATSPLHLAVAIEHGDHTKPARAALKEPAR